MGLSKNRGTPKSSILIGFSTINHPFSGTPIFGKHPYLKRSHFGKVQNKAGTKGLMTGGSWETFRFRMSLRAEKNLGNDLPSHSWPKKFWVKSTIETYRISKQWSSLYESDS